MPEHTVSLHGGVNEKLPSLRAPENFLLNASNVECRENNIGYRRVLGYAKWDSAEVTDATYVGTGPIRGIAHYDDKCYVARNTSNDSKLAIFKSSGSGWSVVKSGLEPSGRFEFDKYSFGGTEKLYGVDGANPPFSLDSADAYVAIVAWASANTPAHIAMHRNRMWVSKGAEVKYSNVGDPTSFTDYAGSGGNIYAKASVTALAPLVGGTLGVFAEDTLAFLSGTGSESTLAAEFLIDHGNTVGAKAYTVQSMGNRTFFLDDTGIIELSAVQAYGGFSDGTVSDNMYDTLKSNLGFQTASCVVRKKNQYRLFFSNGKCIVVSLSGNKVIGLTPLQFPDVVRCAVADETSAGAELILFGSDDGYIYQMESGNAFDDENIVSYATPAFTPCRRPRRVKRYRRAIFDVSSDSTTDLYAKPIPKFDASAEGDATMISVAGGGAVLGTFILGTDLMGAQLITEGRIDMPVIGDYVTVTLSSDSASDAPWELSGITYEFLEGKQRR